MNQMHDTKNVQACQTRLEKYSCVVKPVAFSFLRDANMDWAAQLKIAINEEIFSKRKDIYANNQNSKKKKKNQLDYVKIKW